MNSPLMTADDLFRYLAEGSQALLVCDCSFELGDPTAGRRTFESGHVPGAVYVDLDRDLAAAKTGSNGRHPLPSREAFAAMVRTLGADDRSLVVAYDGSGGMYAARLWWMLRWAGHERSAVLDGGLAAWRAAGGAIETGAPQARPCGSFSLRASPVAVVDFAALRGGLGRGQRLVVDARAPDRFRGENETLDPVGGHIPGALNRCFRDNLAADGRFKPADSLRAEWRALIAGRAPTDVVQQCGSGVTACHNLLAMELAGLHGSALYPGSWSEWCAQPDAPVARGA